MSGKACVDFRNGIYHVYNRGVNKQNIFCDNEDRWCFINLCKRAKLKYGVVFLAFCLMGNHYHLFVRTLEANLSKVMKYINERFSKYYIKKYKSDKKSGHTFMGPYGRRIVQTDLYASTLLSYIHNNPVKDRFVGHPADYRWSSYNYYASGFDQFDFIDKDLLEANFSPVLRNKEGEAMLDPLSLEWEPESHTLGSLFLGDIGFVKSILADHFHDEDGFANSLLLYGLRQQVDSKLMRNLVGSIEMNHRLHRRVLIYSLLEWTELQSPELAIELGLKPGTLRNIKLGVNRKIKAGDKTYVDIVNRIKRRGGLC